VDNLAQRRKVADVVQENKNTPEGVFLRARTDSPSWKS